MGGSSVPSSTYQVQNLVSGPWAVPELKKMMLKVLKPTMGYLGDEQSMMIGVNKGDPDALRKFYGLSSDAPVSDITSAIQQHGITQAPSTYKGPVPLSYANGGLLSFYNNQPRGFAAGGGSSTTSAKTKTVTPAQVQQAIAAGVSPAAIQQAVQSGQVKVQNTAKPAANTPSTPATTPTADQTAISTAMRNAGMTPSDAIQGQAGFQGLGAYDPVTRTWQVTNPALQQLQSNLTQMQQAPSQFGQATNIYNQAASGLAGLTNYQPQHSRVRRSKVRRNKQPPLRSIAETSEMSTLKWLMLINTTQH